MTERFNADEVFEIAEQIERNGAAFYRKAAEAAPDSQTAQLLSQLAEMEDDHEKAFISMREDLHRQRPDWLPAFLDAESEDQAVKYLRALAEGHMFSFRAEPASLPKPSTLEGILSTAIGLEKDSIVFYLGIRDAVPKELGRDRIEKIIREEMSHVTILSRELAALRKP